MSGPMDALRRAVASVVRPPPVLCTHGLEAQPCPSCGAVMCWHPGAACWCGFKPVAFTVVGLTPAARGFVRPGFLLVVLGLGFAALWTLTILETIGGVR